jgi:signal transduction histidine kinase
MDGGSRRSASYAFIPPGDYEFRVRACNNDGVWNAEGARIRFTVMPYIWQTWWFRWGAGGAGSLLLLGALLFIQRRRYRARMRELERQHALERDRTRIARDIHDQVGAHLTRMGMQTSMLSRETSLPETCRPLVQGVAETTHQMLQSMDEIVWAINPRNDTLENVVNYLIHYTREFLRPANIPYKLDLPMNLPERAVPAEVRHNFFMAFKEALNNAVKHGRPRHIRLSLTLSADAFVFTVADDGAGFVPGVKTFEADGLENMRQRMQAVGGSCQIESALGQGARVVFRLPLFTPAERNTHIHAG